MNDLYNIADAGLAAFGVYKDNIAKLSTIKAREYLAKGLPVILGAEDDLFSNDMKYGLVFPNNNMPVDIAEIVRYLDKLYLHKPKRTLNREIRDYAVHNVDNEVVLLPIIKYINNK